MERAKGSEGVRSNAPTRSQVVPAEIGIIVYTVKFRGPFFAYRVTRMRAMCPGSCPSWSKGLRMLAEMGATADRVQGADNLPMMSGGFRGSSCRCARQGSNPMDTAKDGSSPFL